MFSFTGSNTQTGLTTANIYVTLEGKFHSKELLKQMNSLLQPIIFSQDSEGVVRNVHKIALEMLQR